MILMPNILLVTKTEQRALFEFVIPSNLAHFSGHFPGQPILPGIVQVDWAIQLMRESFENTAGRFIAIKGLKFSAPLLPGDSATLTIEIQPEKERMLFAIQSGGRICTSGQYLFSANTTQ